MMTLALVNVWLVAIALHYSYCTEENDPCNNDDCTEENKAMFPSRYAQQFNMEGGYGHDRALDDNSKSYHRNNIGSLDRRLDNMEPSLSENDGNSPNDIGEKKTVFINTQAEYLRSVHTNTQEQESSVNGAFEFPPVKRLVPGSVGDIVELHIQPGIAHKRITRATQPPIFEYQVEVPAVVTLHSTYLADPFLLSLFMSNPGKWNIAHVPSTDLSGIIFSNCLCFNVVHYGPAGHYHAHTDAYDDSNVPCCFHTDCKDVEYTEKWSTCCRLCRFITAMYYLNDVIQGGETAFPLADMPEDLFQQKINDPENSWNNLSHYCHNSSVVVTPRKGTAIVWYTHFVDEKGYLGPVDLRSNHGGCDIIKGEKWIATHWIAETTYEDRFKKSNFGGN